MTLTTYGTRIDLRTLAPRERHPLVFNTFRALAPGESVELVNDHDPSPLREQFAAQWPGRFSWDELQSGPDTWRARITKLASGPVSAHAGGQCCGSCGGA